MYPKWDWGGGSITALGLYYSMGLYFSIGLQQKLMAMQANTIAEQIVAPTEILFEDEEIDDSDGEIEF